MRENARVETNNPLVRDRLAAYLPVVYRELTFLPFLVSVRDAIHQGDILLSHPLSGSIKPGETPYKSVLMAEGKAGALDLDSLHLIEEALATSRKLMARHPRQVDLLSDAVRKDFQVVDLTLIASALESMGLSLGAIID